MSTDRNAKRADYFAILGVDRTATPEMIKTAYREKARQYHPDLNPDPTAPDQFRQVVEAYEVLSDDYKRMMYVAARVRSSAPRVSPWQARQKANHFKTSTFLFYLGVILFGSGFLLVGVDGVGATFSIASDAQPTTCLVERWEYVSKDQYRLHYWALVPWQEEPLQSWREFGAIDSAFAEGKTFQCYYNLEYEMTQIQRYDMGAMFGWLPHIIFGLTLCTWTGYQLLQQWQG